MAQLALRLDQAAGFDFIVIDTPGRDSDLGRAALARALKGSRPKKAVETPEVNGDFYDIEGLLEPDEIEAMRQVRHFMETEVEPVINTTLFLLMNVCSDCSA